MRKKVTKAIFPVAGLGTRFLPATKSVPKEIMTLVDRPLIQYAIDEARAAGIKEFIFVTSRGKGALEDYFDHAPQLEQELRKKGKTELLETLKDTNMDSGAIAYIRQHKALGLGHAVWCARRLVGNEPFAVILPDDVIAAEKPCLQQMVEAYEETGGSMVAAMEVPLEKAPSSTKNKAKARDPEMSSTKKGNDWFFGMKAHIGVDAESGVTHSLETSTAKLHDSRVWDELLHGNETSVWADKGYVSAEREAAFNGPGRFWGVMRKAPKGGKLHPIAETTNRIIAKVRAKVEHPFRVIKRQFGHVKTRYRGLAKNRAQLFTLFALGNLFLVRRKLIA